MNEINERVKYLRERLNINQTDFGKRIGINQSTVAGYERGARTPRKATITAICKEYNVNEEWLLNGSGTIFNPLSRDKDIARFIGSIQLKDNFKNRFVAMLARLDEEDWELLERMAEMLAK